MTCFVILTPNGLCVCQTALESLRRVNLGALQELSTVGCMTSQLRLHNKMASAMHGLLTAQVLHWANLLPNPAHFQVPFLTRITRRVDENGVVLTDGLYLSMCVCVVLGVGCVCAGGAMLRVGASAGATGDAAGHEPRRLGGRGGRVVGVRRALGDARPMGPHDDALHRLCAPHPSGERPFLSDFLER